MPTTSTSRCLARMALNLAMPQVHGFRWYPAIQSITSRSSQLTSSARSVMVTSGELYAVDAADELMAGRRSAAVERHATRTRRSRPPQCGASCAPVSAMIPRATRRATSAVVRPTTASTGPPRGSGRAPAASSAAPGRAAHPHRQRGEGRDRVDHQRDLARQRPARPPGCPRLLLVLDVGLPESQPGDERQNADVALVAAA